MKKRIPEELNLALEVCFQRDGTKREWSRESGELYCEACLTEDEWSKYMRLAKGELLRSRSSTPDDPVLPKSLIGELEPTEEQKRILRNAEKLCLGKDAWGAYGIYDDMDAQGYRFLREQRLELAATIRVDDVLIPQFVKDVADALSADEKRWKSFEIWMESDSGKKAFYIPLAEISRKSDPVYMAKNMKKEFADLNVLVLIFRKIDGKPFLYDMFPSYFQKFENMSHQAYGFEEKNNEAKEGKNEKKEPENIPEDEKKKKLADMMYAALRPRPFKSYASFISKDGLDKEGVREKAKYVLEDKMARKNTWEG